MDGRSTKLFTAVDSIYAAALDRTQWGEAMVAIADACGGSCASLEIQDKATFEPVFFEAGNLPDDCSDDYVKYYSKISPRIVRGATLDGGTIDYDYNFITEEEIDRDEFYSDFLPQFGFRYCVSGHLFNDGRQFGLVAVQRSPLQGHVDSADIESMTTLLPHISRAVDFNRRIAAAQNAPMEQSLAWAGIGLFFVDRNCRVVSLNSRAEALLADTGNELAQTGKILTSVDSRVSRKLRYLVSEAALMRDHETLRLGQRILMKGAAGSPLSLNVVPLPRIDALSARGEQAEVMVTVSSVGGIDEALPSVLRDYYDLTQAEALLCLALANGETLAEYSDRRKVTVNTLRTHLTRIFHKTGARNQVQLVRLLSSLTGPLI